MNKEDEILDKIEFLLAMDKERPNTEEGYFLSRKDRAYRREAITQMFSGLKRENQNKLLELASCMLCNQISSSNTNVFKLLPQGSVINE